MALGIVWLGVVLSIGCGYGAMCESIIESILYYNIVVTNCNILIIINPNLINNL